MFNNLALVFIGGGLGSVLRFLITRFMTSRFEYGLPISTLSVNVIGSLLLGLFIGFAHKNNWGESQYLILFTVGFCGGFTTFSTFSYENIILLKQGDYLMTILYTTLSLGLGLSAAFLGIELSK
ncbi:MAG: fluoride efflux transporter CrcB [Salibacteraceae bacterium]